MAGQQYFAFLPQATLNSEKLNSLSSSTRWIYAILAGERHGLDAPLRLSYKEINKITHYSTATIRKAIKSLAKAGFLEYRSGGLEANPNIYTLEPSWLSLDKK